MLLQPVGQFTHEPTGPVVYDPAVVVASLRIRAEQHMSESDMWARFGVESFRDRAWDRGARTSALADALVEQHGLHVPELLELRRETLAKLERLRLPLPTDVPASTRAWTCAARGEAIAALTDRLAEIDAELERYAARPAPDEDALRALPAWSGAWSTGSEGSALPQVPTAARVV